MKVVSQKDYCRCNLFQDHTKTIYLAKQSRRCRYGRSGICGPKGEHTIQGGGGGGIQDFSIIKIVNYGEVMELQNRPHPIQFRWGRFFLFFKLCILRLTTCTVCSSKIVTWRNSITFSCNLQPGLTRCNFRTRSKLWNSDSYEAYSNMALSPSICLLSV